jgi:hypothetical protein
MTFPLLTKRPTIRPNDEARPWRHLWRGLSVTTSDLAILLILSTVPLGTQRTALGEQAQTTGWSSRRPVQVRTISSINHPSPSNGQTPSNGHLHRGKLNWGSANGHRPSESRKASRSSYRTADHARSDDAQHNGPTDRIAMLEHRKNLRRSRQYHARSHSAYGGETPNVAHHRSAYGSEDYLRERSSQQHVSHLPAKPWNDVNGQWTIATGEADPFNDPFGDRQERRSDQHPTPGRSIWEIDDHAAPNGAENVFDDSYHHAAPLFQLRTDENALAGFQEEPDTYDLPNVPQFKPAEPMFKDLRSPENPLHPGPQQPSSTVEGEGRSSPLERLLEPEESNTTDPASILPTERAPVLQSPFEPERRPTPADHLTSPDLQDLEPFQRDEAPAMPPDPQDIPPANAMPESDLEHQLPSPSDDAPPPLDLQAMPEPSAPSDDFEFDADVPRENGFDDLSPFGDLPPLDREPNGFGRETQDDQLTNDEIPCNREYNDRNCCREDRECLAVLDRVHEFTIDRISLDISPPFIVHDATTEDEDTEKIKTEKLAEAPWRSWADRNGETIASGFLADYREGKVYVRNDERITAIHFSELSRDDLCFVTAYWNLPAECPLPGDDNAFRDFTMLTFTWTASGQCHKPLYFENVALERYGHSAGPIKQHFWSAAHFFGSVLILPYNMGVYPANECRYALGYYEPGDCAPWMIHAFPLSKRGALSQLTFVLGLWGYTL